ncbi:MAG: hypothetical protein IKQ41_06680 [Clostridia bacterium]|nr:hypothetical protein [Clostridia bacterium]
MCAEINHGLFSRMKTATMKKESIGVILSGRGAKGPKRLENDSVNRFQ